MNLDELERLERAAREAREDRPNCGFLLDAEEQLTKALRNAARELIADARRYRWLRSSRGDDFYKCHVKDGYGGKTLKYGIDLDDAIDAILAQEEK